MDFPTDSGELPKLDAWAEEYLTGAANEIYACYLDKPLVVHSIICFVHTKSRFHL